MHAWNALRVGMLAANLIAPFAIAITAGTGYAGSIYSSTRSGGNWYADATPIPGATAPTHIMLAENEGKAITYRYSSFVSNSITMWVPQGNISSLLFLFDPCAETTLTLVSGNVSQWNSKAGSIAGLNAAQATAGNRLAWSATARNGKPGLVGDNAAAKYLTLNSITSLPQLTATSVIAGCGFCNAGANSYRALFSWGPTSGSGNRTTGKGPGNFLGHYGSTSGFDYVTTSEWLGADKIVVDTVTSTSGDEYVDGITPASGSKSWSYNTPTGGIGRIGAWTTGTAQNWYGVIQEIMGFDAVLTTTDRQKVEGYLASKYGLRGLLPGGHPYKSTNPT